MTVFLIDITPILKEISFSPTNIRLYQQKNKVKVFTKFLSLFHIQRNKIFIFMNQFFTTTYANVI